MTGATARRVLCVVCRCRISEARRQRFPTAITGAAGCSRYHRKELSRRTSRRHYRRHHRRRRLGGFAGPR